VSPWIPADAFQKKEAFHGSTLMPLKTFDTGVLQVRFWRLFGLAEHNINNWMNIDKLFRTRN
jgi:hypothetical protein